MIQDLQKKGPEIPCAVISPILPHQKFRPPSEPPSELLAGYGTSTWDLSSWGPSELLSGQRTSTSFHTHDPAFSPEIFRAMANPREFCTSGSTVLPIYAVGDYPPVGGPNRMMEALLTAVQCPSMSYFVNTADFLNSAVTPWL
jgi:hypothetical protein